MRTNYTPERLRYSWKHVFRCEKCDKQTTIVSQLGVSYHYCHPCASKVLDEELARLENHEPTNV